MKSILKMRLPYVAAIIIVLGVIIRPELIGRAFLYMADVLFPVFSGLLLAFVLNVPMKAFERLTTKVFLRTKLRLGENTVCIVSFFLCAASLFLLVFFVVTLMLPAISVSVRGIGEYVDGVLPYWREMLMKNGIEAEGLFSFIESLDWTAIQSKLGGSVGYMFSRAFSAVGDAFHFITSVCVSVVICIYTLLSKKRLARQCVTLISTYLAKEHADAVLRVARVVSDTYFCFFSGQCLEACILGSVSYFAFTLMRIPYAALIGLVCAVFAFVPYLGGIFSFFLSIVFVMMADPSKTIVFCVTYLVVQLIENQLIYPHIVGTSVGMSPLWTVISAVVGGRLFGALGMVFFIPFAAVCARLLAFDIEKRRGENKKADP